MEDSFQDSQFRPLGSWKTLIGVFHVITNLLKGFILRANAICSKEYLDEEITFIKEIFIENGYEEVRLQELIKETEIGKTKKNKPKDKKFTSLPWIPGLSQKLRKAFKKANCRVSFKSPEILSLS